ncbi:hypothetical protein [Bacillus wiedmannii]|uniref:hypothetical protein n=1 Tax=Bacillus wiedmannii TaxID=1890302 RepID=UPI000BF069C2|nr:hypothetical protein [Bacillus wiedmannii]MCU5706356.1 hypothetical protein [Bacillus wiedmannii]PEJ70496.1 hypothetical protein CN888_22510 [Bacillus wiedmannii]PEL18232.1 hypothetical protein CN599_13475 [Bacillus wiedmannii]PHA02589.1 hypothetical protein COE63_11585 [Bacillus wiedmannii]PHA29961.1 hypothetical protein COE69_23785 [Bacillus wiedmannii]
MKKIIFPFLLIIFSIGTVEKTSAHSTKSVKDTSEVFEQQQLSVKQAIELASPSALKWNKKAQLLQVINIDKDKPEKSIGSNGKRKYWNIDFGVPNTNKIFLITIYEGIIVEAQDVTRDGVSPYSREELIRLEDVNYDSPQLLKKALKIGDIHPGKDWAKGYNFMLKKDTEMNIPLMLVIGWNREQTKMKAAGFHVTTGEYIPPKN